MNNQIAKYAFLFTVLVISIGSCKLADNGQQISKDVVPDNETAIKIAEAIWAPMYGRSINKYKPYNVELVDDSIWKVEGTLSLKKVGGVPYIEIRKSDCKIINVHFSE